MSLESGIFHLFLGGFVIGLIVWCRILIGKNLKLKEELKALQNSKNVEVKE